MTSIDKLAEIFSKFPGIGPRQARRFVYYLLFRHNGFSEELVQAIEELNKEISQCGECQRYFARNGHQTKLCNVCVNPERDATQLCIVPRDIDFESIEKSGIYKGLYFVLGGSLPVLEKEPEKRIRIKELTARLMRDKGKVEEVILAMNANTEGENTADYIKEHLDLSGIEVTTLGRGLSTGAELEYADPETLKHAFKHRGK